MLPRKLNIYISVSCVSVAYSSPAEWVAIKGGLVARLRNSKFGVPSGSTIVTYCYYAPARFLKFNPRCGGQGEGSPPAFPALGAGVRVIRSNGQRPPTEAKNQPPTHQLSGAQLSMVVLFMFFSPNSLQDFRYRKWRHVAAFSNCNWKSANRKFSHWKWAKSRWRVTAAQTPGRPASWALSPLHIRPIQCTAHAFNHPPTNPPTVLWQTRKCVKDILYTSGQKEKLISHALGIHTNSKELVCPVYFLNSVCLAAQGKYIVSLEMLIFSFTIWMV